MCLFVFDLDCFCSNATLRFFAVASSSVSDDDARRQQLAVLLQMPSFKSMFLRQLEHDLQYRGRDDSRQRARNDGSSSSSTTATTTSTKMTATLNQDCVDERTLQLLRRHKAPWKFDDSLDGVFEESRLLRDCDVNVLRINVGILLSLIIIFSRRTARLKVNLAR